MDRRTYLRSLGVAGVAAGAGCLGSVPGLGDDETVLDPPEQSLAGASHPSHGDEIPAVELPDPLTGETVSTADFEGERAYLLTFFYTSCPDGACPALLFHLRAAQADATERGYADDIALLALTFDPDRDTPEELRTYADQQGVDREPGNWHFLRPEDNEAAREIVDGELGVPIERTDDPDALTDDEGGDHGDGGDHDHGDYMFVHPNLILLVNEDGVVERAYPNAWTRLDTDDLLADVRTVVGD
ncbi:SCO family protein [Salinilacihabitans rarus]|uniref:SCO family protein n=1 Tax=Salinilacihabitans rarus TaxID=2961596 RepID=UPI0020C868BE|nr:SCO family protein [Salinilacihabitans rarus]